MGIPRLRQHLHPLSETVLLEGRPHKCQQGVGYVKSVVIDGPSLVYHVFWRLLSWSDSTIGFPNAQPTCNEVSCGVMIYLLALTSLGVKIQGIYFDGALPYRKRATRFSRLEKSRRKLELLRLKSHSGLQKIGSPNNRRAIAVENVLRSRPLPVRYNGLPENPFIVSAVFEDLRYRWNRENILTMARDTLCLQSVELEGFPWADITVMVPGEADGYCACTAKHTSSAVLTNDSDLLLYDLGAQGSIITLDSVEIIGWNPHEPMEWQIEALRLSPALVTQRLGISDILRLAFELKIRPDAGMSELVHRAKSSHKDSEYTSDYRYFIQEYQEDLHTLGNEKLQCLLHFDTRVSELFWQYEMRQSHVSSNGPHMYLPILNEDHTRRCAWTEGRLYRNLAFSILNASRPASEKFDSINEFVRRGGRIAVDKMALGNDNWITTRTSVLLTRLESIKNLIETDTTSPAYWIIFSLCELYDGDSSTPPDPAQLRRFLTLGHMDEKFDWADIHLTAQIQSVLYSLRILRQLLSIPTATHDKMTELRAILSNLPPLRVIMGSTTSMIEESLTESFIHRIIQLLGKEPCCESAVGVTSMRQPFPLPSASQQYVSQVKNSMIHKKMGDVNMYDLLPMS
ncbi:XPG domain containing-domain-containing protein [Aspergillus coremiiformis]|uniref:XPG domain containing-domain-containing protein n=1 Tax=Aspergillus coremiiformis TaxID=138285 RepID=A0A5N6YSN0_9EURO|nr:XPG domain containing-domain-containing protein [Aspergillus coremiiformis]